MNAFVCAFDIEQFFCFCVPSLLWTGSTTGHTKVWNSGKSDVLIDIRNLCHAVDCQCCFSTCNLLIKYKFIIFIKFKFRSVRSSLYGSLSDLI